MESTQKALNIQCASVIVVDLGFDTPLDYSIPKKWVQQIRKGAYVDVPVKNKLCPGYISDIKNQSHYALKSIATLHPEDTWIPVELFDLAVWIADYYCSPLNRVFKTIMPSSVRMQMEEKQQYFVSRKATREKLQTFSAELRGKFPAQARVLDVLLKVNKGILLTELMEKGEVSKSPIETLVKKGLIEVEMIQLDRSPLDEMEYFQTQAKPLNDEQKKAYERIVDGLYRRTFETHLLFGVTGSGKTEVYLQAIEKNLEMKQSAIMLVPEIALTNQTIERFRSRFESHIAILHHRLSQGERIDEWRRIQRGEAQIVIGARSALFSPVQNLGLIIVDEEHDQAYKQTDEAPCYHARDVAVMRGKMQKCIVVLGSATPSLESFANAVKGKYHLTTLTRRAENSHLPTVRIIDMKKEFEKAKGFTLFADPLIEGIKKRLSQGEQTILFLNRRGYHACMLCSHCGLIFKCAHCDSPLTFHRNEQLLACHLCDFRLSPMPKRCPQCTSHDLFKYRGVGTEQVERALHALFPEARTVRIDGDTTRHKGSYDRLYNTFRTGKAEIMIGTQMIAKGLHFPLVTLVAVLNADAGLQIPDFRASERTFQLITQVAGRSGRGIVHGEVIIQTQMPENPTILLAARQDFPAFFKMESETRRLFKFPPYFHLTKLIFSGAEAEATFQYAQQFRTALIPTGIYMLPLVPCGHGKIKDLYRFQFLMRGKLALKDLREIQKKLPTKKIKVSIDIDPLNTFF